MTRNDFKSQLPTDPEAIAALAESAGAKFDPEPVVMSVGARWAEMIISEYSDESWKYIPPNKKLIAFNAPEIGKQYAYLPDLDGVTRIKQALAFWLDKLRDETLEEAAQELDLGLESSMWEPSVIRALKRSR